MRRLWTSRLDAGAVLVGNRARYVPSVIHHEPAPLRKHTPMGWRVLRCLISCADDIPCINRHGSMVLPNQTINPRGKAPQARRLIIVKRHSFSHASSISTYPTTSKPLPHTLYRHAKSRNIQPPTRAPKQNVCSKERTAKAEKGNNAPNIA